MSSDYEGTSDTGIEPLISVANLSLHSTTDDDSDDNNTIIQDVSEGEVDRILTFTLRSTYGIELADLGQSSRRDLCRNLTLEYAETLADLVENATESPGIDSVPSANEVTEQGHHSATGEENRGNEATSLDLRQSEWNSRLGQSNEDSLEVLVASTAKKRPFREDMRLRCPFRARNQIRFNVRDHQGCALTSFPSMSDLR